MSYLLDLSKLEPGDIILEKGTTKFSTVIKLATGSEYTHAMLYIGNTIMHALTDGVYSKNPQRLLVDDVSGFKVFRYKSGLKGDQLGQVLLYARNLTGSLYSYMEAGMSPALGKVDVDAVSAKQFCSRLVAQSYNQVGIKIVSNPHFCSPADIANSNQLIEVKGCVRKATQLEIDFANTEDPNLENQRRAFEWLNKARTAFDGLGVNIQTQGDVDRHLLMHISLDAKISRYVIDSKYLEHYDVDKLLNPYRYDYLKFSEVLMDQVDPAQILADEFNREPNEISRHSQSFFAAGLNHAFSNGQYFLHMQQLHKNLLGMSHERLSVMENFAKEISQNKIANACSYLRQYVDNLTNSEAIDID